MTLDDLRAIIGALEKESVEYVLIGGAALNAHGILRATEDIDMMVRPTAQNVDRLRRALRSIWNDPEIDEIRARDLAGDYPAIRYGPPDGKLYLDIISRFGDAFAFEDLESQVIDLNGARARVATPDTLYRMKKDTVRAIDQADAAMLRERFGLKDE